MKEELKKSLRTYGALLLLGVTGVPLGAAVGLIEALFCEVNPIPVKAAMAAMGFCRNCLRLPLTPMEEAHAQQLFEEMRKCGIEI